MDGACSTHGIEETNGVVHCDLDLFDLKERLQAGFSDPNNDFEGFVKGNTFLDQLSDFHVPSWAFRLLS